MNYNTHRWAIRIWHKLLNVKIKFFLHYIYKFYIWNFTFALSAIDEDTSNWRMLSVLSMIWTIVLMNLELNLKN